MTTIQRPTGLSVLSWGRFCNKYSGPERDQSGNRRTYHTAFKQAQCVLPEL
ncbi:MAG: hypothetical protein QOE39_3920, partial [Bradyrhizobium sp.]|nr:hypothetical protein [Bradyrhizobium sp.]